MNTFAVVETDAIPTGCFRAVQRLIDSLGLGPMGLHVAVRIPVVMRAGVDQLDDADAALDQPAGDEALRAE